MSLGDLGKYCLLSVLGKGGGGVVYEAEDTLLQRRVALKTLPPDPDGERRMLREARAAAKLHHPNVVTVHEVGCHADTWFLAMELLPGGSLQRRLVNGPLPWSLATRYAADACRGLAAAHAAGLMHRDVKPANLLLARDGSVKVADFGLVKVHASDSTLVPAGHVAGTPDYMSPEQCQGVAVDARSDVYSLGATYFALLTGRPPYVVESNTVLPLLMAHCGTPPPDPREFAPAVPAGAAEVVRRAMAKRPTERYPDASAMLSDLELLLAGEGEGPSTVTTLPPLPTPDTPRARSRRRFLIAGAAACAGGVGLALWPRGPAPLERPDAQDATPAPPPARSAFRDGLAQKDAILATEGGYRSLVFSPDGKYLAAGCGPWSGQRGPFGRGASVWKTDTGERAFHAWKEVGVTGVAFSPDGTQIAAGGMGHTNVLLFDLKTGLESRLDFTPTHPTFAVAFLSGPVVVAGLLGAWTDTSPTRPILWFHNFATSEKGSCEFRTVQGVRALAVAPDESALACTTDDDALHIFHPRTLKRLHGFRLDVPGGDAAAFSPTGKWLAVASGRAVLLFDPADWRRPPEKLPHGEQVRALAFAPGGDWLFTADDSLRLWDVARRREERQLHPTNYWVGTLAVSRDGLLAAGAKFDHTGLILRDPRALLGRPP